MNEPRAELVRPIEDAEWEPEVVDWARKNMVKSWPYSITTQVARGSVAVCITGEYQGIVRKDGDKFVHLESTTMHHYVDSDFIVEIRPLKRIDLL